RAGQRGEDRAGEDHQAVHHSSKRGAAGGAACFDRDRQGGILAGAICSGPLRLSSEYSHSLASDAGPIRSYKILPSWTFLVETRSQGHASARLSVSLTPLPFQYHIVGSSTTGP